ncbi:MAG: Ig-like domain-containing protein, partial [Bacteroidales bacterium]
MKERLFRFLLLLLGGYLLVSGCAKMNTPTGGPKDREAPKITNSVPPNGTVNFKSSEVVITFNEYVVLDKINEKFMVSPPMKRKPKVFTRGKSVHIQLFDKLRDSTTYTFYFQDAIRDLNEGNPISNYQFVLSTGPVIDSLSVTGNALTGLT